MLKKLLALSLLVGSAVTAHAQQFKALLFTKTAGFHHVSIHEGVTGVRNLAARHNFSVDWQENADVFNDKSLANYSVVIFLNTTGDILNEAQQAALEKYIKKAEKGWVGIHAAADTEYDWPWYGKLCGAYFKTHPAQQTAFLDVKDSNFPGLERFPKRMMWTDEWYEYKKPLNADDLKVLITIDEKTYDPKTNQGTGMGDHPIAWYHNFDGGRAFYTGLGHIGLVYSDQSFLDHLYGGIYWAATGKGLK